MPWINTSCAKCGAEFRVYEHPKRPPPRYCTQQCWLKVHNNPERNAAIARATTEARADMQRDRGEGKTYRKRGGRHEHRAVAEKMIGRPLRPGEVVHHRDGNKRNNDPANLEVMTRAEHSRRHSDDIQFGRFARKGGDAQCP